MIQQAWPVLSDFQYPVAASLAGLVYLFGRYRYVQGYSTGEPEKRYKGAVMYIGSLAMLGMVTTWGVQLLLPGWKSALGL